MPRHSMRLKELIKDLNYLLLENTGDCQIKGISCNSQSIKPGYLFVAIKGQSNDGHSFVSQAIHQGAAAVILQKDLPLKEKVAKILVSDSRVALAGVCSSFFGYPTRKLKVIGITGTCGKTTVSYLLERILISAKKDCAVLGTVNYRLGERQYPAVNTTPQADILQAFFKEAVLAKYKYAIMEVSSHALSQHRVDGVTFSAAVFTNLSSEHLDYHRTLRNYFSCKAGLFNKLAQDAYAIINTDDRWGRSLAKKVHSKSLSYGIEHPAQIQAKNLKLGIAGSRFTLITPKDKIEINSPLIGRHNVYNILAASGAAFAENIGSGAMVSGIENFCGAPGRLERLDCGQDFLIFIDYAHTEEALKNVLLTLRQAGKGKIISVFGCGGDRDKTKRPKMGRMATRLSDFVIITCDNPRSEDPRLIVSDIVSGIDKKKNNYKVVLDRFSAIKDALTCAGKGDIVLLAGKGHESSQIFADKTIHFNDRQATEAILQAQLSHKLTN